MTIAGEVWVFLYSCLLGVGFGVVYDVFRILRLAVPTKKWLIFLEDYLFFLIAGAGLFLFLLHFCYGHFRFYVLLGAVLGFILYFFTVGIVVVGMAKWIIFGVKWIFRLLYRLFLAPPVRFVRYLVVKFKQFFRHISQKMQQRANVTKFYLKPDRKVVYNGDKHTYDFGEGDCLNESQKEQGGAHR